MAFNKGQKRSRGYDDQNNHQFNNNNNNNNNRNRPFFKHKNGNFHKNFDQTLRLMRSLAILGDSPTSDLTSEIQRISAIFAKELVKAPQKEKILDLLPTLAHEQSFKIPVIGAVLISAILKDNSVSQILIPFLHTKLVYYLNNGHWISLKLLIRLLASINSVLLNNPALTFLEHLTKRLLELNGSDLPNKLKLSLMREIARTILLSLPYVTNASSPTDADNSKISTDANDNIDENTNANENDNKDENDNDNENVKIRVTKILEEISYLPLGDALDISFVNPFVDNTNIPYQLQDSLKLLISQLQKLSQQNWDFPFLLKPWIPILNSKPVVDEIEIDEKINTEENALIESQSVAIVNTKIERITFPETEIPELSELKLLQGQERFAPEPFIRIFVNQQVQTTPLPDSLESTILRDAGTDLLVFLDFNRIEVARQITAIDLYFGQDYFAPPAMPIDSIAENSNGPTWKIEDLAVEIIFANMFSLPAPSHKQVYYHSVLIELCLLAPQAIAPVFGRAIRFIYSLLDKIDTEIFSRFLSWFSHHLSNFAFAWKWNEWITDLELNDLHPRKVFIKQLLAKELRLSFYQRIEETIPDEFKPYLIDPGEPEFKYHSTENPLPFSGYAKEILTLIKERKPLEDLSPVFDKIRKESEENMESAGNPELIIIDIVVSAVCDLGSRSLSHADSWIDRSLDILKSVIGTSRVSQRQAVKSILTFWKLSSANGVKIVTKLCNKEIIELAPVLEFYLGYDIDTKEEAEASYLLRHDRSIELGLIDNAYIWESVEGLLKKAAVNLQKVLEMPRTRQKIKVAVETEQKETETEEVGVDKEVEFLNEFEPLPEELLNEILEKEKVCKEQLKELLFILIKDTADALSYETTDSDVEAENWVKWWRSGRLRSVLRNYAAYINSYKSEVEALDITQEDVCKLLKQTYEFVE